MPDNFDHQNVNDTKFVFSERTLEFLLQQAADGFEERPWETGEILGKKAEVLWKELEERATQDKISADKQDIFQNKLAFLELSVVFHSIFIQRFLNRHARLVAKDKDGKEGPCRRWSFLELQC